MVKSTAKISRLENLKGVWPEHFLITQTSFEMQDFKKVVLQSPNPELGQEWLSDCPR